MADRKGFTFLRSYYEAAKELSKEEQADFLMAVCSYALDGEEPDVHGVAAALFKLAKPNIEVSLKRSEAGKNKSNEEQNEANDNQNEIKTETNEEQNANKIETSLNQNEANKEQNGLPYRIKDIGDRSKDKRIKEVGVKNKEPRHKHGQYQNVLLSDNDLMKLQAEFPSNWQAWIEKVSEYCRSHGKTYADYLAVIRNWARREKNKSSPNAWNDVQAGCAGALRLLGGADDG